MRSIRHQRGWAWLPAAISAAGALIGGYQSRKAEKAQRADNTDLQREFAQQGVQWKVQDAEKAGIHPLYALGAQTSSYQPQAIGDSMGPALASAGQNIGRAIDAQYSANERQLMLRQAAVNEARAQEAHNVDMAYRRMQTAALYAQMGALSQPGHPPPRPTTGDSSEPVAGTGMRAAPTGLVRSKPSESVSADPRRPGREAGATPAMKGYAYGTKPGQTMDYFSPDFPDVDGPGGWLGSTAIYALHMRDLLDDWWNSNSAGMKEKRRVDSRWGNEDRSKYRHPTWRPFRSR